VDALESARDYLGKKYHDPESGIPTKIMTTLGLLPVNAARAAARAFTAPARSMTEAGFDPYEEASNMAGMVTTGAFGLSKAGLGPEGDYLGVGGGKMSKPVKIPRFPEKESMIDTYKHSTDLVPIEWLKRLPGNKLRQTPEAVAALGQLIERDGMENPLIINVGAREGTAKLGEGNHRLAALEALGYTHVPARVSVGGSEGYGLLEHGYRKYSDDLTDATKKFHSQELRPSEVFKSLSDAQRYVRPEPSTKKARGGAVEKSQRDLGAKLFSFINSK
jgi:hypothetical protein